MPHEVVTLKERPQLMQQVDALSLGAWPRFLLYGNTAHWRLLFSRFPGYQVLVCAGAGGSAAAELLAVGNSIPMAWDGTKEDLPPGIQATMERGMKGRREHANSLAALATIVSPNARGRGLSAIVLRAVLELGRKYRFGTVIAPVRPMLKSRYPLVALEEYLGWTREDGSTFDPWLRTHLRLGATIEHIVHRAVVVEGKVDDWRHWTGRDFDRTGSYVVEGALQPVWIDLENDVGRYEDPNIWVRHDLR